MNNNPLEKSLLERWRLNVTYELEIAGVAALRVTRSQDKWLGLMFHEVPVRLCEKRLSLYFVDHLMLEEVYDVELLGKSVSRLVKHGAEIFSAVLE